MPEIMIKGYKCSRCNYEWHPKNKDNKPIVCPHCHNPYWDRRRLE